MKKSLLALVLAVMLVWSVNILAFLLVADREEPAAATVSTEQAAPERLIRVLIDGTPCSLPLSDYLTGVLISEMPAAFHMDAKKAQAVAARTFALRMEKYSGRHGQCAVCSDPGCCQGYLSDDAYLAAGGSPEGISLARQAVLETDGTVLTYHGDLIEATYFSCSGGRTEDAVAVWGREIPYLQAVESPGEEDAFFYVRSTRFTAREFQTGLGVSLPGTPDSWFGAITYTDGQGVNTMEIGGRVYSGNELRQKLQLRSTWFTVFPLDNGVIITTRGFGHRVGMSQYGADAMARQGVSWQDILQHYYQGVTVATDQLFNVITPSS